MLPLARPKQVPISKTEKCRNCGSSELLQLFEANDFDTGKEYFCLKQCSACKLVYTSPLLNDTELSSYYKKEYYGKGDRKFSNFIEKWTIRSNVNLAESIIRSLKKQRTEENKTPKVLDIGCGRGNLLKVFSIKGFECHGIEREEFPDHTCAPGVTIHKTLLKDAQFDSNYFDVVVMWHVLEHLHNPSDILKEISRILRPTGILVIAVPNFGSFQSRLFKKHWFHLDLPRHLHHFDKLSIENLLTKYNFNIVEFDTRAFDQSVYGFIQSAINCIPWFKSNSFYEQLKLNWKDRNIIFYLQAAIATIFLPLSLIEYLFSALQQRGSCLILSSVKTTKPTAHD